jgi:haloalkane dehalogenase
VDLNESTKFEDICAEMDATESWRAHYPFTSHELRIGGNRYHYLDEGTGPVLLMVHGNPTWSFYWRNLIQALRPRYRVIVPDHIGCGLSDKPQDYPYRLQNHIDNLGKLIEHLDLREITLLAHDWGGAIGMGAAVAAPARFARFVLFNTAAFRSQEMPLRIRICRAPGGVGRFLVRGLNGFLRGALVMGLSDHARLTPAVHSGYLAPYNSWANRIAIHRFVLDIPLDPSHPSYQTLQQVENGLAQFRDHPVQLVWGMRDWCFTGRFLDRFRDFFPQAEVQRFEDAGHWVIEDAHERIIPLVERFIERTSAPQTAP